MVCDINRVKVCHLEGGTMLRSKPLVLLVLVAAGAVSLAVMLVVSMDTGFLPGMVELSVGLAAAAAMSLFLLASPRRRSALFNRADEVSPRQIKVGVAGVAILAASAGLAASFATFPWPVGLLAAALVLFAAAGPEARQASGGSDGKRRPEVPGPATQGPRPQRVPLLLSRRSIRAMSPAPARAWARCGMAYRSTMRCRRHAHMVRPLRRVPVAAKREARR